jgi:hypothetical protein
VAVDELHLYHVLDLGEDWELKAAVVACSLWLPVFVYIVYPLAAASRSLRSRYALHMLDFLSIFAHIRFCRQQQHP